MSNGREEQARRPRPKARPTDSHSQNWPEILAAANAAQWPASYALSSPSPIQFPQRPLFLGDYHPHERLEGRTWRSDADHDMVVQHESPQGHRSAGRLRFLRVSSAREEAEQAHCRRLQRHRGSEGTVGADTQPLETGPAWGARVGTRRWPQHGQWARRARRSPGRTQCENWRGYTGHGGWLLTPFGCDSQTAQTEAPDGCRSRTTSSCAAAAIKLLVDGYAAPPKYVVCSARATPTSAMARSS